MSAAAAVELVEPSRTQALAIKARAAIGTLLCLLAINGLMPLVGHSPAGIWAPTAAAAAVLPAAAAPVKAAPEK